MSTERETWRDLNADLGRAKFGARAAVRRTHGTHSGRLFLTRAISGVLITCIACGQQNPFTPGPQLPPPPPPAILACRLMHRGNQLNAAPVTISGDGHYFVFEYQDPVFGVPQVAIGATGY